MFFQHTLGFAIPNFASKKSVETRGDIAKLVVHLFMVPRVHGSNFYTYYT
jgi:hypothetical protein